MPVDSQKLEYDQLKQKFEEELTQKEALLEEKQILVSHFDLLV